MSALIVEIRAAEGGDDAKALVIEQTRIYLRLAGRRML
jgi:protein subunit release factor A